MALDDELLNRVTWKIPNALALVGSRAGDERNAMTTSWITQLSMEPVLIGVGVDNAAVTRRLIHDGGSFTVNLWDATDTRVFVKFSKPAVDEGATLNGRAVRAATTGAPVFEEAVAWVDCAVRHELDLGSHTLFVGEVVDAGIVEVPDPTGLFVSRHESPVPGTCVTVTMEGRRPLLAEVQALTVAATTPSPRRSSSGLDSSRVAMLLAVLTKTGVSLSAQDVYTASVGGARLHEPAVDLFRDGVHPRGIRAVVRLRQALQRARSLSARCRRPGSRDGPTKQPTSSPFAVRGDTTADQ